jgi:NitT/TauT family transport system substrate-binding protein
VDTTAVIIGDYSNGNDAVLVRHNLALNQTAGKRVLLVEKTVSQYLFERAMAINNQAADLKRVKYVNTSDSDIASAFLSDTSQEAVVTWKPLVSQILTGTGAAQVFGGLLGDPGPVLSGLCLPVEMRRPQDSPIRNNFPRRTAAWPRAVAAKT